MAIGARLMPGVVALLLAACGMVPATIDETQDGMGLPRQFDGETYPGERAALAGEVVVAGNGCVYLAIDGVRHVAIWPRGSSLSEPARLPDGTELAHGDTVEGIGATVAFAALPGGADGYWGHVTGFCPGDVPRAVVIDEVSEVR